MRSFAVLLTALSVTVALLFLGAIYRPLAAQQPRQAKARADSQDAKNVKIEQATPLTTEVASGAGPAERRAAFSAGRLVAGRP